MRTASTAATALVASWLTALPVTPGQASSVGAAIAHSAAITDSTDISASRRSADRRHHARPRAVTKLRVYRDGYSWFIPYARPVPHFYPFGYELGYF